MRLPWQHIALFLPGFFFFFSEISQPFNQQTQQGDKWQTHSSSAQLQRGRVCVRRSRVTSTFEGTIKRRLVWHGQVLRLSINLRVSGVRPLFAFLIYCWPLPHLTCAEESPLPPPLNTLPHINKPYRCRNAWGPALSLPLEFSPLIRGLLEFASSPYSRLNTHWLTDPTSTTDTSAAPLVSVHT